MAVFTGHDGVIKFASTDDSLSLTAVGNLRNFTIEQTQDTIETTVMGATGNMRTYVPGLSTFTMSGDLFFDGENIVQTKLDELVSDDGESALATFEAYPMGEDTGGTGTKLSGSVVVTSLSITSSVDGMVEASFAAQGSGALTFATIA